jgi:cell wall-associated NlpC family hydrolase
VVAGLRSPVGDPVSDQWRAMTQDDWHQLQAGDLIRLGPGTVQPGLLLEVKIAHSAPWTLGAYRADGKQPKRFYSLSYFRAYEVKQ